LTKRRPATILSGVGVRRISDRTERRRESVHRAKTPAPRRADAMQGRRDDGNACKSLISLNRVRKIAEKQLFPNFFAAKPLESLDSPK
jgi:hypothetical protein